MVRRICLWWVLMGLGCSLWAVERPVILVLKNKDIEPYIQTLAGFSESLNRLKNPPRLEIYQFIENNQAQNERLLITLQTLKPDVIFTMGTTVAQYVSARIKTVPIVFSMVVDPVGSGLLAENMTGVTLEIPVGRQLEILKQSVPHLKNVGVLYNPAENESTINQARLLVPELGLTLNAVAVSHAKAIPDIGAMDIDALWMIPDNTICQPSIIQRLLLSGLKSDIPVMGISASYARAGALLALSSDYFDIGRQAAEMVEKLLRGEKCSNLKILAPREIQLFLNLAVAERLGIRIPAELIKKAAQVFGR